ncbi:hypothetical protein LX81_03600 [Palleronia aestuarii]|uniref:Uncharacterized protein n=2 Tax=Palleronia aestuarii TaxID=568105 RepID=A0A2W7NH62_9RHOB|nr:hypothetical protein LX81_03600 [Palleronia aestuarii]
MPRVPPARKSPTPQDPEHPTKEKKKRAKLAPVSRTGPLPIASLVDRNDVEPDTPSAPKGRRTQAAPASEQELPIETISEATIKTSSPAVAPPRTEVDERAGEAMTPAPTEPEPEKRQPQSRKAAGPRKPRSIRLWLTRMQEAQLRELAKELDIEVDYLIDGLATRARHRLAALRDASGWRELSGALIVTSRRTDDGRRAKHSSIALSDAELREATAPIRDPLGVLSDTLVLNAYFDAAFAAEAEIVRNDA